MSQALNFAIAEHGTVDTWEYYDTGDAFSKQSSIEFAEYFKKYLKITKDCGPNPGCLASKEIRYLNGGKWSNYNNSNHYKMILADGTYLWLRNHYIHCTESDGIIPGKENTCGLLWIDVNGKNQPNTFGKDVFAFLYKKRPDNTKSGFLRRFKFYRLGMFSLYTVKWRYGLFTQKLDFL